jgi:hypothetical protein
MFTKIRPVVAELLHADGQTDRFDQDNSRFSQLLESTFDSISYAFCLLSYRESKRMLLVTVACRCMKLVACNQFGMRLSKSLCLLLTHATEMLFKRQMI